MGDIKRNEAKPNMVEKKGKEVELSAEKRKGIEITRGNIDLIVIRMLEAINKNLAEIIKLLSKDK